jgi:hypothetical protein
MLPLWETGMTFVPGEGVVQSWAAKREEKVPTGSVPSLGISIIPAIEKLIGMLVLTNQRLLFVERAGLVHHSYKTTVDIPLDSLERVWGSESRHWLDFTVQDSKGETIFHVPRAEINDFETLRNMIQRAAGKVLG